MSRHSKKTLILLHRLEFQIERARRGEQTDAGALKTIEAIIAFETGSALANTNRSASPAESAMAAHARSRTSQAKTHHPDEDGGRQSPKLRDGSGTLSGG